MSWQNRFSFLTSVLLLCLFVPHFLFSRAKLKERTAHSIQLNGQVTQSMLNIGNWGFWAKYDGLAAHNPFTGGEGGYFPKGKVPVLYLDGILWGAYLRDPDTGIALNDTPRVGGIQHRVGTSPGWINSDGTPADVNDARVRLYRIRSDWRHLSEFELRDEAAYLNHIPSDMVTAKMMQDILEQYKTDWKEWPVDLGAPYVDVNGNGVYDPVLDSLGYPDEKKGDYPGLAHADQVIWMTVNDLNERKTLYLSGSYPIGLEVHFTFWTYKGNSNPLNNVIFKRIEIFNKSGYRLDSMYVSIFSDPDIGDYLDDFVGCDSTKNIAFAYNGHENDVDFMKFGLKPAAIVYDLLQGPIVNSNNPQDTAVFNFQYISGHRNLPMTSFGHYTYGDVPPLGPIDFTLQWYNRMRGYAATNDIKHPTPQIFRSGPQKGKATKFPLSGNPITDPNAQYGDVDGQGENLGPGDRNMYLNSGPFTMQPGEKQDILIAIIGGLGKDRLKSLKDAWYDDNLVKLIYKQLFKNMPGPPEPPLVRAAPLDDKIVLNWGFDQKRIKETENKNRGNYVFEGYTVYQLPSAHSKLTDSGVKRLVTYDRIDGVKEIYGWIHSSIYHRPIYVPLQIGTDSGIRHFFIVHWDSIKNRPLYRGSTYYFAVTAYNYNPQNEKNPSIESQPVYLKVTVQGPKPGDRYEANPGQKISVEGDSTTDVKCSVSVVDPTVLTGDKYEIFFTVNQDSASDTFGEYVWNVRDVTKNQIVLTEQKLTVITDPLKLNNSDAPVIDGLGITVYMTHPPGIKAIVEVANGNGPLTESQWDDKGAPYHGNNVWHSLSAPNDLNRFYLSAGGDSGNLERLERSIGNAKYHDFEMRFTTAGGIVDWFYNNPNTYASAPFEMWDVGIGTYDDASDDQRLITLAFSPDSIVGNFSFHTTDPSFGFPATDWIFARRPLNENGTYERFVYDVQHGIGSSEWMNNSEEVLAHIIICDFGGARTLPETGTVIRFITYKRPKEGTKFYFTAPGRIENDPELAKKDVEKINVFPNPYYGSSELEPNRFTHFVTFNHLPRHAIFRIFTLNGILVRKLEKNDASQFFRWDLKNENGLPVASGLYIVHIEMPELKKTKILKLMVVGLEEVPNIF